MLAALVVLAGLSGASGAAEDCGGWHGEVLGFYPGVVESDGRKAIDTWVEQGPDGRLQGRYVLHEAGRDVPGTLEAVGDQACDVAVFRWTDLYGSGLASLRFDVVHRCFDGAWGRLAINPALVWHACVRERVTS